MRDLLKNTDKLKRGLPNVEGGDYGRGYGKTG